MPITEQSLVPNLDPTIPAPMINVAEYGFEGRFEDWADDAELLRVLQGRQPHRLGVRTAGPDYPVRSGDLPGSADRRDSARSVQRAGYQDRGGDQPRAVGQFLAHPARRADRHPSERHLAAVLRALRAGLRGGQRPAGRVGKGRLFDAAGRYPFGVLRCHRDGHVLGARRAADALPGRRSDPSRGSARPSSAVRMRWPSWRRSPPARAPTTRAGSACCWPTPTRSRR